MRLGVKTIKIRHAWLTVLLIFGSDMSHAANAIKGGELYAVHCSACHGMNGISMMPGAPNFARSEGILRPDFFLLNAIKEGKNAMPGYQGILSDGDILDVIAHLRTLN